MGIRFFCHHCQSRLNVKFSQAGLPGVCPDCGGTVDVPTESLLPGPPKSPSQRFYVEEENPPEGSSQLIGFDAQDTIAGDLLGEDAVPKDGTIKPPSPVFAVKDSSGIFMLASPLPSPDFGKVCPVETAPDKVWYFRSKELGERGPLKARVMRQHVKSGDVYAGCMVWRQDWDDWLPAEAAFPQIEAVEDSTEASQSAEAGTEIPSILSKKPMAAKQVVFYGAIVTGLVVIAALGYVVVWIARSY